MLFEIDDLQMWLEDSHEMPQAYWDAVEAGTDQEYLAEWLGYESPMKMYTTGRSTNHNRIDMTPATMAMILNLFT